MRKRLFMVGILAFVPFPSGVAADQRDDIEESVEEAFLLFPAVATAEMSVSQFDEGCRKDDGKLHVQGDTHTCVVGHMTLRKLATKSRGRQGMAGVKTTRGDAYEYLAGKMGPENTKEKQLSATLYTWNRDKGFKITLSVGDEGTMVTVELP